MASVYKRGKTIYVSWFDPLKNKTQSKSFGMEYNKENLKIANKFAKDLQDKLNDMVERFKKQNLVKSNIGKATDHFYKNNSNKAPGTIEEYDWFFEKFNKRFSKYESCNEITKLSCEDWLTSLRTTNYQPNTLYKLSKVLKKFLRFLFEYNYIPMFLLNKDVTFKMEVKPIITFSDNDLDNLVEGLKKKNSNFRTTIYLLLYTGLRPSDIYELAVKDIDLEKNSISYYLPKTKDYLKVPIHQELKPILEKRIIEVKNGKILEYEAVDNIGKAYRRYLTQLKLQNRGYTLRTFRKTFISLAHANGMDLATVAKLAGHKKITTTEKYYNKLSLEKQSQELLKLKFPFSK
ncbi:MAG: site-specific integrase [Melioribacteraceae bacterium]